MVSALTVLEETRAKMVTCTACNLCEHRTQVVFGEGNIQSPALMLIGEAPGAEEDIAGRPFIGRAGKKLDEMLVYAGIKREDAYITNSQLCKPPNNRTPTFKEIMACRWRLLLQIDQIKPKLIVTLGRIAAQAVHGREIRGNLNMYFDQFHDLQVEEHKMKWIYTYHPSYLLRNRKQAFPIMLKHWTAIKDWLAHVDK